MHCRTLLILIAISCFANSAIAVEQQSQSQNSVGPHRGTLRTVDGVQTETIVDPAGIRVYFYDSDGKPMDVGSGRGLATLSVQGNHKRYRYALMPADQYSLTSDMTLTPIAGRQVTVDFMFVGIPGIGGQRLSFRDVSNVPAAKVAAEPRKMTVQIMSATNQDSERIAKQGVCPVMDEPLGSMGDPIKLLVDDKPIYLCCKGCIKRVQADPAKYLAMTHGDVSGKTVSAGTEAVREHVYKVTADDAPFVAAQKICPVMEEPLDAMGGPFKVDADGKAIYICCPGCAKLIIANPDKYVAVLAEQGVEVPTIRR